jgi:Mg-chelatase subunit ChlI
MRAPVTPAAAPGDASTRKFQYVAEHRASLKGATAVNKKDLRSLERLAKKNREASQAAHEAEAGRDPAEKKGKRNDFEEKPAPDPRYEGADRLFTEMKKRDRP